MRACVVSVHNLDVAVESLSLTDLAKRSVEPVNSAKVTSLFASVADSDEIQGEFHFSWSKLTGFLRYWLVI